MSKQHAPLHERLDAVAWALEASLDIVFAADMSGRLLFANAAARQHWHLAAEKQAEQELPSDVSQVLDAAVRQVVLEKRSVQLEWGTRDPMGARRWYNCTLSPLIVEGTIEGYLSVSTDATQLKRSEERLRRSEQLMVDTQGVAHLGTWEWDISEPVASWSAELYRIYGLTPETYEPSYDKYLEMVHPEDRERVKAATTRVFQEHVPYSHDERIFRPDGSVRYLHTWAHPVLDEQGKLVRLVGVCQDITEQKLAEQQVVDLNTALEQRVADRTRTIESSLRDLEAFNAMASHDLRAPLSVIQGSCELLLRQNPVASDVLALNLQRISRASKQMTTLVNDLMALAQVGHAAFERRRVDLTAICQEVIERLRGVEPERGVSVNIAPGMFCFADGGLLRVALDNLLGNAWKYSARVAAPVIEVGAVLTPHGQTFFVRDNGIGFDMSEAHRLFAPFQRLQSSVNFAGTGIGLAGTQRIIERHGGRIWAESAPNQGATFFIALPSEP